MLTIESLAGNPLRLVAPGRLARVVSMAIGLLNVLADFGIDRVSTFKESVESEQLNTRWHLPSALSDCEGLRKGAELLRCRCGATKCRDARQITFSRELKAEWSAASGKIVYSQRSQNSSPRGYSD